jgi:hypothetical protein
VVIIVGAIGGLFSQCLLEARIHWVPIGLKLSNTASDGPAFRMGDDEPVRSIRQVSRLEIVVAGREQ